MPTLSPFTGKEISSNSSMILWNLWDYIASTKLYFAVDACTGWFSSTNSACMTFPTKCSVCPLFIATTESVHAHFVFEFFFYPGMPVSNSIRFNFVPFFLNLRKREYFKKIKNCKIYNKLWWIYFILLVWNVNEFI